MAHQSLYRRYRSRNFKEILGQPHVTDPLRSAVAEGRNSHAYLFSGPRGTGKTSTARVLAKALNCPNVTDGEPCSECDSCIAIEHGNSFDLHELDAASHNKVDDMRDLISKVQLGSPGRTKVYILDEVHMLSSGAENALLKTLEEPPEHVAFVLATTEPHKVVPTIRSRTQHFRFHLLGADELADHVRWVIDDADLDVDEEAIDYILRQGGGSARDTLSALDLVAAGGIPEGTDTAENMIEAIGQHDAGAAIAAIQKGLEAGIEPRTIGEDAIDALRNAFLTVMGAPLAHLSEHAQKASEVMAASLGAARLTNCLESIGSALVEMRQAPDPRVVLEVTVLSLCRTEGTPPGPGSAQAALPAAQPVPSPAHQPANDDLVAGLQAQIERLEGRIAQLEQHPGQPAPAHAFDQNSAATSDAGPPVRGTAQANPSSASGDTAAANPDNAPGNTAAANPNNAPAPGPAVAPDPTRPQGESSTNRSTPRAPRRRGGSGSAAPRPRPPAEQPAQGGAKANAQNHAQAGPTPAQRPAQGQAEPAPAPAGQQPSNEPTPASPPNGAAEAQAVTTQPPPSPLSGAQVALTKAAVDASCAAAMENLTQRARVRLKVGRVLAVEGSTVLFGLPNQIHRDRAVEVQDELVKALGTQLQTPVSLELVVDGSAPAPSDPARFEPPGDSQSPKAEPPTMGGSTGRAEPAGPSPESEVIDLDDLTDAADYLNQGIDRINRFFPGSELIEDPS